MQIDLATLVLDWFEEHYPGMCYTEQSQYASWDCMMLCIKDIPKGRSHFLGRFSDTEFIPWIFRCDDPSNFRAADPEFFNKIDVWFKTRVIAKDWTKLTLAEEWMTPSPPPLRDI